MKFKEGDWVYDTKYDEIYQFEERVSGFAVTYDPDRFRLATEAEIATARTESVTK